MATKIDKVTKGVQIKKNWKKLQNFDKITQITAETPLFAAVI